MKLSYQNNLSSLAQLASDIENFSTQNEVPPAASYALNLCLDEVLTNIIVYNKNNSNSSIIEIELSKSNNQITATIRDSGTPFNPLENLPSPPDLSSPIEDRPIGGLGVYFLEQYMDNVQYKHENNHNILTLTKHIS